jgi:hypothetical protein
MGNYSTPLFWTELNKGARRSSVYLAGGKISGFSNLEQFYSNANNLVTKLDHRLTNN